MTIATAFASLNTAILNWGKAMYHRLHYTLVSGEVVAIAQDGVKTYVIADLFPAAQLTQSEFDMGTLKVDVQTETSTAGLYVNSEGTVDVEITATNINLLNAYSAAIKVKVTVSVKRKKVT